MVNDLRKISADLPDGCYPVLDEGADGVWYARISNRYTDKNWKGEGQTQRDALIAAVQKVKREDAE